MLSSNLCLFSIGHENPGPRLFSNVDWELGRTTGMFLVLFKNSKLSGFTFMEKV